MIVDEALSEDALAEASGETVFVRDGAPVEAVDELIHSDGGARATVHGTVPCQVQLAWDQNDREDRAPVRTSRTELSADKTSCITSGCHEGPAPASQHSCTT